MKNVHICKSQENGFCISACKKYRHVCSGKWNNGCILDMPVTTDEFSVEYTEGMV